ncbi:MAG TPA: lysophospholipid acyltransferase family protein [Longimicrobium sp.]|nr:lysophospholipid acyltransferase family protein [Longimicrobium sp.]
MTRSAWFLGVTRPYVRRRLARGLDGFYAEGVEAAREVARERPVILVANHVGWWDSFLVVALDEALGTEGYALMDAASVRRLPFFGRLGALPLDRTSAARSRAGLREGAAKLDRPGRALWIFPQGHHRPAHLRPLGFRGGVTLLARMVPEAATIPIAIQYAWGEGAAPAAWAHLGAPLSATEATAEALEEAVGAGLARIDRALAGDAVAFPALVPPRTRGEGLGARLLGGRRPADG